MSTFILEWKTIQVTAPELSNCSQNVYPHFIPVGPTAESVWKPDRFWSTKDTELNPEPHKAKSQALNHSNPKPFTLRPLHQALHLVLHNLIHIYTQSRGYIRVDKEQEAPKLCSPKQPTAAIVNEVVSCIIKSPEDAHAIVNSGHSWRVKPVGVLLLFTL